MVWWISGRALRPPPFPPLPPAAPPLPLAAALPSPQPLVNPSRPAGQVASIFLNVFLWLNTVPYVFWLSSFLNFKSRIPLPTQNPERWKIKVKVLVLLLTSEILLLSSQRGRCSTSRLLDYRVSIQEYGLPSNSSFKCNVLLESLSEVSQNIPGATLNRRGSWVISIW